MLQIAPDTATAQLQIDPVKAIRPEPAPAPIRTCLALSDAICPDLNFPDGFWCLQIQANWINDQWHPGIWVKSIQIGATKTDALDYLVKPSKA